LADRDPPYRPGYAAYEAIHDDDEDGAAPAAPPAPAGLVFQTTLTSGTEGELEALRNEALGAARRHGRNPPPLVPMPDRQRAAAVDEDALVDRVASRVLERLRTEVASAELQAMTAGACALEALSASALADYLEECGLGGQAAEVRGLPIGEYDVLVLRVPRDMVRTASGRTEIDRDTKHLQDRVREATGRGVGVLWMTDDVDLKHLVLKK
jgi:hypothetical protein